MDRAVKQSAVRELTRPVDVTWTSPHDRRLRSLDRVVITGGAGLLDGRLCTELVSRATHVVWLELPVASPASPIGHLRLPIETLKVGSIGTPRGVHDKAKLVGGALTTCTRTEAPG
jgi:hypothetical protein